MYQSQLFLRSDDKKTEDTAVTKYLFIQLYTSICKSAISSDKSQYLDFIKTFTRWKVKTKNDNVNESIN